MATATLKSRITHLELICCAFQFVEQRYMEAAETLKQIGSNDPNPWQEKLDALCDLYRIETGGEYNLDIKQG